MTRPTGKIKTRKSTLGATKKERTSKSLAGSNTATLTSFSTKVGGGVGRVDAREESAVAAEGIVERDAPPPPTPSIRRMMSFRGNNNHKQQVPSNKHNKKKIKEGSTTKESINSTKSHRVFSSSPLHRLMKKKKKKKSLSLTTTTTNGKNKKKSTKKSEEKHYTERVELVAMKNENDQPFTRILISKTLHKQRVKKRARSSPSPSPSSSSSPSNQEQTPDERAVAVPPPAAAVTAVTDVTAKNNKTMISVSKCQKNEPAILETIYTSQLCGNFDSIAFDEVVREGCQASVEDSMGIGIIPTCSSPTMTCLSTAPLGYFTNNNNECDDVPTTTIIPISPTEKLELLSLNKKNTLDNDGTFVEKKELGKTEMRQLITTNNDEAVASEGKRDAPPPPPPPSIRRLMSFRGNNKNKQQVPSIDKISRRKERNTKKLRKKNKKKNESKIGRLHNKKVQQKNAAAAAAAAADIDALENTATAAALATSVDPVSATNKKEQEKNAGATAAADLDALENTATAAALATSVVPVSSINKKEQEKNAAAAAADLDALVNVATAVALASCVVPVSTTNKCLNNDEDSSYSISLCSSESESDVSDSRSDSDSDDSALRSEDSYKNKGFLSKLMHPWSKNKSKGIPQSVSYVTDDDSAVYNDSEELDVIYGPKYSDTIIGTMPNIGIMSEFGSVFGFGTKKVIDVRDLRMVGSDSDISNSSSSSGSSSSDDSTVEEDNNYGDIDKYEYDDIAYSPCISHIVSPSFSEHNESGFSKERTFARKETKIESRYADVDLALAIDLDLARSLLVLKNHAAQLGVDPTELLNGIE